MELGEKIGRHVPMQARIGARRTYPSDGNADAPSPEIEADVLAQLREAFEDVEIGEVGAGPFSAPRLARLRGAYMLKVPGQIPFLESGLLLEDVSPFDADLAALPDASEVIRIPFAHGGPGIHHSVEENGTPRPEPMREEFTPGWKHGPIPTEGSMAIKLVSPVRVCKTRPRSPTLPEAGFSIARCRKRVPLFPILSDQSGLEDPVQEKEPNNPISVVLVEDNLDLSQTVQAFLAQAPELQVLGAARGEKDFKALISTYLPDVALIDIGLDTPRTGLELLEWLAGNYPVVKPIIMTVNRGDVLEAYQRGAKGYVLKSSLEILVPTLREVAQGKVIIPPGVGELFVEQMAAQTARFKIGMELLEMSEREREILALLKAGVSREDTADRLSISFFTVRRHIQNILEKTGQSSVKEVLKKFGEVLSDSGPNRG